ncbi:hypothetical protein RhiirC2_855638 [Rhizophagus irregularis]|uniref:Crinkler effector protein N-terminal domain-containing protein n=1 Tax=Rhizophagus irregularis TaxID=588596 RepID=A0A2N1MLK9_9GLOM|nr:hypothetical protein RhiirC2_855638 [Rhizophagus irregularis]
MEKSKSKPTPSKSKFSTSIPTKKITHNCLVYREPPSCYFQITAKNETTDTELKELIKKCNEPDFNTIATRRLLLWIVNVPLESELLDDVNVNIADTLNGRKFLPPSRVGTFFKTQPPEGVLHIIVESPLSTVEVMRREFEKFTVAQNNFLDNVTKAQNGMIEALAESNRQQKETFTNMTQALTASNRQQNEMFTNMTQALTDSNQQVTKVVER